MKVPDKIEVVQFVCSACGKRSTAAVVREKIKCGHCKEVYRRVNGEWVWKMKDNPR
jgi:ribosomal protein S27AE